MHSVSSDELISFTVICFRHSVWLKKAKTNKYDFRNHRIGQQLDIEEDIRRILLEILLLPMPMLICKSKRYSFDIYLLVSFPIASDWIFNSPPKENLKQMMYHVSFKGTFKSYVAGAWIGISTAGCLFIWFQNFTGATQCSTIGRWF